MTPVKITVVYTDGTRDAWESVEDILVRNGILSLSHRRVDGEWELIAAMPMMNVRHWSTETPGMPMAQTRWAPEANKVDKS